MPATADLFLASRFRFNINSLESGVDGGLLYRAGRQRIVRVRADPERGVSVQVQGRFLRGVYAVGGRWAWNERVSLSVEVDLLPS